MIFYCLNRRFPDSADFYTSASAKSFHLGKSAVQTKHKTTGKKGELSCKDHQAVISLGADADPLGMSIADNKLYVAGTWTGKVYVIDLSSTSPDYHTVVKSISVGDKPCDAVSRADGSYVYISHNSSGGDKI